MPESIASKPDTSIRLATKADCSKVAGIAIQAWRDTLWHRCYFDEVADEDYAERQIYEMQTWFLHPTSTIYVAERSGAIVGYAVLVRLERNPLDTPPPTPTAATPFPPGTNVPAIMQYRSRRDEWKAHVLTSLGSHFRLEHVGVLPSARKHDIGSLLLDKLITDVFAQNLPLFFETIDELLPFYDHVATRNGSHVKKNSNPVIMTSDSVKIRAHFLQLVHKGSGNGDVAMAQQSPA